MRVVKRKMVDARSLLCYWAVCALGMNLKELSKVFGISPFEGRSLPEAVITTS